VVNGRWPGFVTLLARRTQRQDMETTMRSLLVLLLALTMACGAAASLTVSLAPAYADDAGKGY
jgi:hypothetical protein